MISSHALHSFCLFIQQYPSQPIAFLSNVQDISKLVPFYPVFFPHRKCLQYYVPGHVYVNQDSKSHFQQRGPYQYIHMRPTKFLMRAPTFNLWTHQRCADGMYRKPQPKECGCRKSRCTNNVCESLARSPGPQSFGSFYIAFNPQ